jgi:hypothetical protein
MRNVAVLLAVCCAVLALTGIAAAASRTVIVEMMTATW